jgi:hypothetical protein
MHETTTLIHFLSSPSQNNNIFIYTFLPAELVSVAQGVILILAVKIEQVTIYQQPVSHWCNDEEPIEKM